MKWHEPRAVLAVLILSAVTLACLIPFLGKAVHMDDPLFIWTARHIQSDPLNFYGFNVHWVVEEMPMSTVTQNPPLASYYMAVVAALFGWSEYALHFGFLLPALAVVIGTYFLAKRLCSHPFAAALATVAAPGFLLSSTSLMCDTAMVALWVWAVLCWMKGLAEDKAAWLGLAASLIVACSLTKYYGMCLIPLLLVYSVVLKRRAGPWLLYLFLSIIILAGYQWMTRRLYGHGLLMNAAAYATALRQGGELPSKVLETLAFTGGCALTGLAAVPLAWGKRGIVAACAGAGAMWLLLIAMKAVGNTKVVESGHVKWLVVLQMGLLVVGGAAVVILAAADFAKHRDAAAALLLLWIAGTLVFTGAINWTIAGRNILPLVPAAAIVLVRRLEGRAWAFPYLWWPLGISLAVGLLVSWADFQLAEAARTAAFDLAKRLAPQSSLITFEGHWGFQYYMEMCGATPLDRNPLQLVSNELVILPRGNSYLFALPDDRVSGLSQYRYQASKWMGVMSPALGAGYYSDIWGSAPFMFGAAPPELYLVYRIK